MKNLIFWRCWRFFRKWRFCVNSCLCIVACVFLCAGFSCVVFSCKNLANETLFCKTTLQIKLPDCDGRVDCDNCCVDCGNCCVDCSNRRVDCSNRRVKRIVFLDSKNDLKIIEKQNEICKMLKDDTLVLEVLQNQLNPILIYFCDELYPKGFLYPYATELSLYGGFSAHCFFRLLSENDNYSIAQIKDFASYVNWKKFFAQLENFENPWDLDQNRLLNDIATKSLTKRSFAIQKI